MSEPNDFLNWRAWVAPSVVGALAIAVISWQLEGIRDRFTSVEARSANAEEGVGKLDDKIDRRGEATERRVVETNQRIDRVLENQTSAAAQLSTVTTDLNYIKGRLDRVAERLNVAAADPPGVPTAGRQNAITALERAGIKVFRIEDLTNRPSVNEAVMKVPNAKEQFYVFTPDQTLQRQIETLVQPR